MLFAENVKQLTKNNHRYRESQKHNQNKHCKKKCKIGFAISCIEIAKQVSYAFLFGAIPAVAGRGNKSRGKAILPERHV